MERHTAFSGEGYMSLFKPAYSAIRSFSPNITVISAGLAPADSTDVSINDREYLRQMYQHDIHLRCARRCPSLRLG